jgi:hypothetical protein
LQVIQAPWFARLGVTALVTFSAAGLMSCGHSRSTHESAATTVTPHPLALPKDDVLHSIELRSPPLPQPASPWRREESQLFADLLKVHRADVLVIPFEVQDRGFDRIERSLMTEDFASALARQGRVSVINPYLAARAASPEESLAKGGGVHVQPFRTTGADIERIGISCPMGRLKFG